LFTAGTLRRNLALSAGRWPQGTIEWFCVVLLRGHSIGSTDFVDLNFGYAAIAVAHKTIEPYPRVISAEVELANGIAMRYEFIWESDKYLWVKFFGAIDGTDLNNATNGLYNDFRLDSLQGVLWDFSGIDSFDVTDIDAEEIAYTDFAASHYKRNMKAAFITQNPGLAKLTKLYVETMNGLRCPWENRLFDNVEEASRWSFG
jgi:hypothetical protein